MGFMSDAYMRIADSMRVMQTPHGPFHTASIVASISSRCYGLYCASSAPVLVLVWSIMHLIPMSAPESVRKRQAMDVLELGVCI